MANPEHLTIMFVSHTDAFGTFRVGSHHLARELSKLGHRVLHVSTPVSLAHRLLRRGEPTREVASRQGQILDRDGVTHLVPRTVFPAGFSHLPYRRIVSDVFGQSGVDIVFLDQPTLWSPELRQVTTRLVYRPTDLYETGKKARLQRTILDQADSAVATSDEVLARLPLRTATPSMSLPNGVELGRFTDNKVNGERPHRAIYVGALDNRFDWDVLRSMALKARDWAFEIYGPGEAPAAPLPSNVTLHGVIPYDRLPGVLQTARIGLLPLSAAPVNQGRSPMKLFEYLAAGLAVVTRETPVIRARPEIGLFTYASEDTAISAFNAAARTPVPNAAGASNAAREDWAGKALELIEFAWGRDDADRHDQS